VAVFIIGLLPSSVVQINSESSRETGGEAQFTWFVTVAPVKNGSCSTEDEKSSPRRRLSWPEAIAEAPRTRDGRRTSSMSSASAGESSHYHHLWHGLRQ
jgi:hypothetical protein